MEVRPLTVADAALAGTVLAARHQRERAVFPLLAPALEDPAAAAEMGILTHRPAGRMLGTQRTSSSVIEAVPPPG
jgi:hypothetical protein